MSSANITAFPALFTFRVLLAVYDEGVSVKPINVLFDPEPVSVFVKVILSPDLAILSPVPTSNTTSSLVASDPVNLNFS